ncbi:MAG: hypothetical protein K0R28_5904 [Paenibacillus sp.]|jgi:peptidoglycan hydrolase CwlO-like protein|nr:hypothetical protein [Paenibacillus sp.]
MEEMFNRILSELQSINAEVQTIKSGLHEFKAEMHEFKTTTERRLDRIEGRLDSLDTKVDSLDKKLDSYQSENITADEKLLAEIKTAGGRVEHLRQDIEYSVREQSIFKLELDRMKRLTFD